MLQKYEQICEISQSIYYISSILIEYCNIKKYNEEIAKIYPILILPNSKLDDLYLELCEWKEL